MKTITLARILPVTIVATLMSVNASATQGVSRHFQLSYEAGGLATGAYGALGLEAAIFPRSHFDIHAGVGFLPTIQAGVGVRLHTLLSECWLLKYCHSGFSVDGTYSATLHDEGRTIRLKQTDDTGVERRVGVRVPSMHYVTMALGTQSIFFSLFTSGLSLGYRVRVNGDEPVTAVEADEGANTADLEKTANLVSGDGLVLAFKFGLNF